MSRHVMPTVPSFDRSRFFLNPIIYIFLFKRNNINQDNQSFTTCNDSKTRAMRQSEFEERISTADNN